MLLFHTEKPTGSQNRILIIPDSQLSGIADLSPGERKFAENSLATEHRLIMLNRVDVWTILLLPDSKRKGDAFNESLRLDGCEVIQFLNRHKAEEVVVENLTGNPDLTEALAEGMVMAGYQFLKYHTQAAKRKNSLTRIGICDLSPARIADLNALTDGIFWARDLVNEPLSWLNAPRFADEISLAGKRVGFSTEILGREEIEKLGMGGLLAVNKGSIDPPRFIIMTWEPEGSVNVRPLVLVGKGIVYDTGGMSLKPTPNSMDEMKSDMAGAAAVAGAMYTIARMNLPVRVISLIPATDNRPDGNAYVPGDVIRMFDGTTVEVLNTDAEGRLILADALGYAKRYEPELVIDLATLTGSAQMCLGSHAAALMATAGDSWVEALMASGEATYERLVRLPLWEEYDKLLESEIADLKNIGGRMAGAITAGKFLQRFTDYPWIHLDIAGTAFFTSRENYRGIGGTGYGVRLLLHFIKCRYLANHP